MFVCNFILKLSIPHCQQINSKTFWLYNISLVYPRMYILPISTCQNPIPMDQLKAKTATEFSMG